METGEEVRCRSFVVDVENLAEMQSEMETSKGFTATPGAVDEEDRTGTPSAVEMNEGVRCCPQCH